MTLDFNPNLKPKLNTWATYIPDRSTKPKFATHRIEAHAKSALGSGVGIIYEFVDGEWEERFRRDEPDAETGKHICEGCSCPHIYRGRDVVPDGEYLRGYWAKGELRYEYWCGYSRKCKRR